MLTKFVIPFPQFKNKHNHAPLFSPRAFLQYQKMRNQYPDFEPTQSVVFLFNPKLMKHIQKKYNPKKVHDFQGDLYLVSKNKKKVLIMGNFGIGAPVTVANMEELIAFGIKRFLIVGRAGCLQSYLPTGQFVVCDRAIRDEGTSHHYLKNAKYSYASPELVKKTTKTFLRHGTPFSLGTTWTIDAPYRETKKEVDQYRKQGALTVEMEAASVFAVAQVRHVQAGAIFTVSDHLGETKWTPKFEDSHKPLEKLFDMAVKTLTS